MARVYTLKELHELFLVMIREFHDFCIKNNLTYYMVGGTLLGAVREKGFIPWDDDVDFAMPRDDYEKFIQIYDGNLSVKYYKRDKESIFPYIKLAHSEMPVVSICDSQYDIESKVFLTFDIYPIDGVGMNLKQAKNEIRKVDCMKQLTYLNISNDLSRNVFKACATKIIRKIPTTILMTITDKIMQRYAYRDSELVTRWRMPAINNIVEKNVFGSPVLMQFEDLKLFAPAQYKKYLEQVYGDYMIPRKEEQGLRHDINTNNISRKFAESLERKTKTVEG